MEADGSGTGPAIPAYHQPFLDLVRARGDVDSARKDLARAERAERAARQRILGLLKRVEGPVAHGNTLYLPSYATARGEMVDFREVTFTWACDALKVAAAAFAPVPRPDPEPADCEPPTARKPVRPGWVAEATAVAVLDDTVAVLDDDGEG